MNQNLDLLRQNYCRPAVASRRGTHSLFPLERACQEGKAFLAKVPKPLIEFQEFSPYGLHQTYRDEASGLDLPVFAVFDLEGQHQLSFDITTDAIDPIPERKTLPSYLPLRRTQTSVREINNGRMKAEGRATQISVLLGIIFGIAVSVCNITTLPGAAGAGVLAGIGAASLAYLTSLLVLARICPRRKLVLSAEFDGILPTTTREKALAARHHFDRLYLVVDQQNRWKSALLPDPTPRALDPLLIGELKEGNSRRFFLIDQFDLTAAEQYLVDEFAVTPDETTPVDL